MDAPKKPGLLVALGIGKPKKPDDEAAEGEDGGADAAAGDAVFEAIANKDSAALAAAIRMCVDAKMPSAADPDGDGM